MSTHRVRFCRCCSRRTGCISDPCRTDAVARPLGVRRARRRRQPRRQVGQTAVPAARSLLVSPPGSRRQVTLSGFLWRSGPNQIYLPLCGGRPWVEPIRPRPRSLALAVAVHSRRACEGSPRLDRAARARGRARPRLRRGRSRSRDHRDRRPHRQGRRAGAAVREPEGRRASAPDQPVRHRAADVPRLRRRVARRRRRARRRRARDAAAARADGEDPRPAEAQVDRGCSRPKTVGKGACQEIVLTRRRRRPRRSSRSSAAGRATRRRSSRSRP